MWCLFMIETYAICEWSQICKYNMYGVYYDWNICFICEWYQICKYNMCGVFLWLKHMLYVNDLKYVNIICMVFTMIETYAIYVNDLKYVDIIRMVFTMIETYALYVNDIIHI